jgi:type I restriction enzyme S subunit
MFGLAPKALEEIRFYLAELPAIERVLLYGSRAKGCHKPGSDIDLTLLGKNLTQENSLEPLMRKLDESSLPYLFDLSIFSQLDSSNFIAHILRVGKLFYLRPVNIPKHWEIWKFEECLEKVKATKKIPKKKFLDEGSFPIVSQEDQFINGYWNNPDDIFHVSKPVVIFGDHTKKVKYIDFDFVLGADGVKVFLPKKAINSKFFAYQLQNYDLEDLGYARHYRILKAKTVAVPPLSEQKSIVAILDGAFAAIDQAKAKLEKNIANAKELFQSKLNTLFSQKGDGWVEKSLGELTGGILTGPFGSLLHKKDYIKDGIPLINPAHITKTRITHDANKTVDTQTAQRLKNYKLEVNDIIIGRRGDLGRCAVVTTKEEGWLCGTGSFIIRHSPRVESEYLVRLMRSHTIRERLELIAGGAVMKNLSNKSLSKFTIRVPPLGEQKVILVQFNSLCSVSRELEAVYQKKLAALEKLKKSILQKAFSGELTEVNLLSTCAADT